MDDPDHWISVVIITLDLWTRGSEGWLFLPVLVLSLSRNFADRGPASPLFSPHPHLILFLHFQYFSSSCRPRPSLGRIGTMIVLGRPVPALGALHRTNFLPQSEQIWNRTFSFIFSFVLRWVKWWINKIFNIFGNPLFLTWISHFSSFFN